MPHRAERRSTSLDAVSPHRMINCASVTGGDATGALHARCRLALIALERPEALPFRSGMHSLQLLERTVRATFSNRRLVASRVAMF